MYTTIHTNTHMYAQIHMHIYIYIYMCMHIHADTILILICTYEYCVLLLLIGSDKDSSNDGSYPEAGFYVYDLGSTHGMYLNKQKVRPCAYCCLRVGQMVRFGGSTRMFILEVHRYIQYKHMSACVQDDT